MAEVLRQAARGLWLEGQRAQTFVTCLEYADRCPTQPWGYIGVARVLMEANRLSAAHDVLEYGLGRCGCHPSLHYWIARCYQAEGKLQLALEAAWQAIQLDQERRDTWYLMAQLYERLGKLDNALAACEQAAGGFGDRRTWQAYQLAGRILLAQNQAAAAVEKYQCAADLTRKLDELTATVAQADALLDGARRIAAASGARASPGRYSETRHGDRSEAPPVPRSLGPVLPEGAGDGCAVSPAATMAAPVLDLGLLRREAQGAQALAAWEAYIEASPAESVGYIGLARVLLDLGRSGAALAVVRKGLLETTPDSMLYHWLARCLEADGKVLEALEAAEQAVRLEPGNRQAWFALGRVYERLEWHKDALEAYTRAADGKDDHLAWPAYEAAGRLLSAKGWGKAAAVSFERAAAISGMLGEAPCAVARNYALLSTTLLGIGRELEAARARHRSLMLELPRHQLRETVGVALAYLAALTAAELITAISEPRVGLVLHAIILVLMLLYSARTWGEPIHRLLLALALAPLIRVLSLSLPLADFPVLYWYLIISIPLLAAVYVVVRLLRFGPAEIGLTLRWPMAQFAVASLGLVFGWVEYTILQPGALVENLTWGDLWLPALILLASTGFVEELIFRGVMQATALEIMGKWGVVYVAVLSTVLHIGYLSLTDVVFVFGASLVFGGVALLTRSILGVSLAHGLTNIVLFLILPLLQAGGRG